VVARESTTTGESVSAESVQVAGGHRRITNGKPRGAGQADARTLVKAKTKLRLAICKEFAPLCPATAYRSFGLWRLATAPTESVGVNVLPKRYAQVKVHLYDAFAAPLVQSRERSCPETI
jgi:hypothetical protein